MLNLSGLVGLSLTKLGNLLEKGIFLWLCLFLSACQLMPSRFSSQAETEYEIVLKAQDSEVQKVVYTSTTEQKLFFIGEPFDSKSTRTEFVVESRFLKSLSDTLMARAGIDLNQLAYQVTTLAKDGDQSSNPEDFGFPPLGKPTIFVFDSHFRVLKAGDYGMNSVFYVAPVPLPKKRVKVGETWDFEATWVVQENEIPFEIRLAVILKEVSNCPEVPGQNLGQCALLEVSGTTQIASPYSYLLNFSSEVSGEMLFSIQRGLLVSSRIRSEDRTIADQNRTDTVSILRSQLVELK